MPLSFTSHFFPKNKETYRRAECLSPTSFGAFSYVNEVGSRELLNLNTNLEDLELRALTNVSEIQEYSYLTNTKYVSKYLSRLTFYTFGRLLNKDVVFFFFLYFASFCILLFCILRVYLHYISGSSPLKDDHSLATLHTDSVQHTF